MQRGKYKCKQLKAVRKRIADENGIPLEQRECSYDGPCRGTCPHCEAEVRYLERALTDRIRLGRAATVAGLSLGLAACGGAQGSSPVLTTDSTLPAVDTLPLANTAARAEDTAYPDVVLEGLSIVPADDELPDSNDDSYVIEGKISYDMTDSEMAEVDPDTNEIYHVVAEDAEFPGGFDSATAWLERNVRYPEQARSSNFEGKVWVRFVVEKDGSISNAYVVRPVGYGCDEEALRVVNSMPRWKPGRLRGQAVRVWYPLPVKFTLK